jgi:hypothetical protein
MRIRQPTGPSKIINWSEYNASLRQRGRVDLLLEVEMTALPTGRAGRPLVYSEAWVEAILLLGVCFNRPLRQLSGMVESLVRVSGRELPVPSPATLCERRQQMSEKRLSRWSQQAVHLAKAVQSGKGAVIVVDSSGLSIRGVGSWRESRPWNKGKNPRRDYLKIHVAIDARTQQIVSYLPTTTKTGDATAVPALLEVVEEPVATVVADGAYDTEQIYRTLAEHDIGEARIPPRQGAVLWPEDQEGASLRNANLTMGTRHRDYIGGGKAWRKHVRYGVRSLVETTFSRMHAISGNRLRSRSQSGRLTEVDLLMRLLNKHTEAGLPMRAYRTFP